MEGVLNGRARGTARAERGAKQRPSKASGHLRKVERWGTRYVVAACREPLPAFAWPGDYPMYYVFNDGGVCCPKCANANIGLIDMGRCNSHGGWELGGYDVNYEDTDLHCDHCGEQIPAAYAG